MEGTVREIYHGTMRDGISQMQDFQDNEYKSGVYPYDAALNLTSFKRSYHVD